MPHPPAGHTDYHDRVRSALAAVLSAIPSVNDGTSDTIPRAVLEDLEDLLVGSSRTAAALLAARDIVTHVRECGALPRGVVLAPLEECIAAVVHDQHTTGGDSGDVSALAAWTLVETSVDA
jgi:hypothetical protein